MRRFKLAAFGGVILTILAGCMTTAAEHQRSLGSADERAMTLGTVQKEIRPGMSQADVATALGSPNIVTRDSDGNETWIYDKIATEVSYSQSSSGVTLLLIGGAARTGAAASTQRSMTVVIKFDKASRVASYQYHSSKF